MFSLLPFLSPLQLNHKPAPRETFFKHKLDQVIPLYENLSLISPLYLEKVRVKLFSMAWNDVTTDSPNLIHASLPFTHHSPALWSPFIPQHAKLILAQDLCTGCELCLKLSFPPLFPWLTPSYLQVLAWMTLSQRTFPWPPFLKYDPLLHSISAPCFLCRTCDNL